MLKNKDLYPTPNGLARKMLNKVDRKDVKSILEPSAGLGDLAEIIKETFKYTDLSCIEIDEDCQDMLRGKGFNLIDSDFLAYNGLEQFDLIVANFPFSDGDKHLHKAIDVLFSGQIVCLINAETLKNPYSNSRKDLVQKLKVLNADIEYIPNAFLDAERKTNVEVALVYIQKIQNVETDLFDNISQSEDEYESIQDSKEIAVKDNIGNIVKRYNQDKELVTNQVMDFYRNYNKVSKYLDLKIANLSYDEEKNERYRYDGMTLTQIMKHKLNQFSKNLKKDYWLEAMKLDEVTSRITSKKKEELIKSLNQYAYMDFTETNIRIFIKNLIAKYPVMIDEGIGYVFDKFTEYALRDERYSKNEYKQNIHLYNGWKTNEAYKVNKKVILPFTMGSYLSSDKEDFLNDIDLIFNYFDDKRIENDNYLIPERYNAYGSKNETTTSSAKIVKYNLVQGITKSIKTRYFTLNFYLKGTVHFIFNDLELLRKFNIYIAKKRGWLPANYSYSEKRNKDVDFESKKEYKQIGNELAINTSEVLMIC